MYIQTRQELNEKEKSVQGKTRPPLSHKKINNPSAAALGKQDWNHTDEIDEFD